MNDSINELQYIIRVEEMIEDDEIIGYEVSKLTLYLKHLERKAVIEKVIEYLKFYKVRGWAINYATALAEKLNCDLMMIYKDEN